MAFNLAIFILGLLVGSFLNCLIYRLEQNQSFLRGRSFCPECKKKLGFWDLIPIFSFLFLKGRCRYCRKKISWQYPLVELSTAFAFLLVSFSFPGYFSLAYHLAISSFLIVIFVYDLKHYLILDKVIYPAIAFSSVFLLAGGLRIFPFILSALGTAFFFWLIILVSRGKWLGWGDVKLAFFMGLLLGWPKIILALFLANLLGAIIGLGLIAFKRKSLKSAVPFGPFLALGTFVTLLWGERIISWYLSFLNP